MACSFRDYAKLSFQITNFQFLNDSQLVAIGLLSMMRSPHSGSEYVTCNRPFNDGFGVFGVDISCQSDIANASLFLDALQVCIFLPLPTQCQ
jgi:hypothetical protein